MTVRFSKRPAVLGIIGLAVIISGTLLALRIVDVPLRGQTGMTCHELYPDLPYCEEISNAGLGEKCGEEPCCEKYYATDAMMYGGKYCDSPYDCDYRLGERMHGYTTNGICAVKCPSGQVPVDGGGSCCADADGDYVCDEPQSSAASSQTSSNISSAASSAPTSSAGPCAANQVNCGANPETQAAVCCTAGQCSRDLDQDKLDACNQAYEQQMNQCQITDPDQVTACRQTAEDAWKDCLDGAKTDVPVCGSPGVGGTSGATGGGGGTGGPNCDELPGCAADFCNGTQFPCGTDQCAYNICNMGTGECETYDGSDFPALCPGTSGGDGGAGGAGGASASAKTNSNSSRSGGSSSRISASSRSGGSLSSRWSGSSAVSSGASSRSSSSSSSQQSSSQSSQISSASSVRSSVSSRGSSRSSLRSSAFSSARSAGMSSVRASSASSAAFVSSTSSSAWADEPSSSDESTSSSGWLVERGSASSIRSSARSSSRPSSRGSSAVSSFLSSRRMQGVCCEAGGFCNPFGTCGNPFAGYDACTEACGGAVSSRASQRFSSARSVVVFTYSSTSYNSCLGTECAEGGDFFCALQGGTCTLTPGFPCITCRPPSSSQMSQSSASSAVACATPFDCPFGFTCRGGTCVEQAPDLIVDASSGTPAAVITPQGECRCAAGLRCVDGLCLNQVQISELPPYCGNARIDAGEQCDEGGNNSLRPNALCRPDCTPGRCGDGILDTPLERCDDGNALGGDGCSALCQPERAAPEQTETLPAQIIELPFQQPAQVAQQPVYQQPDAYIAPATPQPPAQADTGPAALAVMVAGAAAGYGWMRRRR